MSTEHITGILLSAVFALLAYWLGIFVGGVRQRAQWHDHMNKCNRYIYAVDDLDRWCGHASPHARLVARHIKAHGEGEIINAGSPAGDEACTVSGLREQLKRLDAKANGGASTPTGGAQP